jgi:enoyl-CoA hydratase/carnithine racemase
MMFSGRTYLGTELAELGLVSQALPGPEVLDAALELARDIATNTAPLSVGLSKRALWQSLSLDIDQVERLETELHHSAMGSPDAVEGVMAFLERRDPEWTTRVSEAWPPWPEL